MNLFSVNTIAFTILDYPMSYIELVGTIFYLLSVWLIARRNMLTWPIGIISVILYMILFYQIQLYSDTIEQVYYLIASIYGWWHWNKALQNKAADQDKTQDVFYSSKRGFIVAAAITAVLTVIATLIISQIHLWLPTLFPEPASYAFLDALTTVMSFTAMWLMAQKRIECWHYWIIVDVIGIWLYYVKGVKFISLLYVILLVMAVGGLISWHKARQQNPVVLQQVNSA
jgi:nicotinamide mononucleotide transporter